MSAAIHIHEQLRIVEIVFHGAISIHEISQIRMNISKIVYEKKYHKFLSNLLDAELELDVTEITELPNRIEELAIMMGDEKYKKRGAILIKKEDKKIEFLVAYFNNRGLEVKIFYDKEEAKEWLSKE